MSEAKTINELRKIGIDVLAKSLGPTGMLRFIQSFDLGRGDYTKERLQWLDQNINDIVEEIRRKRIQNKE